MASPALQVDSLPAELLGKPYTLSNIYLLNFYIYFALLTMPKPLTVGHNKLWKILQEMGIDHLTCLLRNLYAGQEATIRTGYENNGLVLNWERSTSRLYIVTLLI